MIASTALSVALATGLVIIAFWKGFGPDGVFSQKKEMRGRIFSAEVFDRYEKPAIEKRYHLSDIDFIQKFLTDLNFVERLANLLRRARLNISVSVFLLSCVLLVFSVFIIASLYLTGLLAFFLAFAVGVLPFFYLRFHNQRYLSKFSEFLPNGLSIISNSIKVGHGLDAAFTAVAQTAPYPVSAEFQIVKAETQLGQPLQSSMENLYARIPLPELKIFVTGISIHQELGGNLSEILDNLEDTIRQRFSLQREVKALSAQGVMSSWVLFAIPLVMMTAWFFSDPRLMMDYVHSETGRVVILVALGFQLLAFFWIKKIVNLKA